MSKVRAYVIGKSTTLESNKSPQENERLFRQILHRMLLSGGHHHVWLAGVS
jgi:hypothetical protein